MHQLITVNVKSLLQFFLFIRTTTCAKNILPKVGRVDRALVRNLIVGYVTADQAKRPEILRCLKHNVAIFGNNLLLIG